MLPTDVFDYFISRFEFEGIVLIRVVGDFGLMLVDDFVILVDEFEIMGRIIALFPSYLVFFTLFEDERGVLFSLYFLRLHAYPTSCLPFKHDRGIGFDFEFIIGVGIVAPVVVVVFVMMIIVTIVIVVIVTGSGCNHTEYTHCDCAGFHYCST